MDDHWSWLPEKPVPCRANTERMDDSSFGELHQQRAFIRKFCKDCPVAYGCLRSALRFGSWDGVFGGMTAPERSVFDIKFKRPSPTAQRAHEIHLAAIK